MAISLGKFEGMLWERDEIGEAKSLITNIMITELNYNKTDPEDLESLRMALGVLSRLWHQKEKVIKQTFEERWL